jgi:hypothetical protein
MTLVVCDSGVARSTPNVVWREDGDLVALETWLADDKKRDGRGQQNACLTER